MTVKVKDGATPSRKKVYIRFFAPNGYMFIQAKVGPVL